MSTPPQPAGGHVADGCAEPRAAVESACAAAKQAKDTYERSNERLRSLRRDLTAARHAAEEAERAADPAIRAAEKAAARDTYRLAKATATGEDELREATATYARTIDRSNRFGLRAVRAVERARREVLDIEAAIAAAERHDQAARLESDQAEAACLDARVRLAACEEGAETAPGQEHATVFEPHAATGGHAVVMSATGTGPRLVIESMVGGDRVALELAAGRMSDHLGLSPAESQLQLQALVEIIVSAAAHGGFLVFDEGHPFWSSLSLEESRDVVAALDRLGFVLEPAEGWHAGRVPTPADLSMALAYAGLDARHMRALPDKEDLAALPRSIRVDARAFLAARAPRLTVDDLVSLLGQRATELEPLWNEWGMIRPILLADRDTLAALPG